MFDTGGLRGPLHTSATMDCIELILYLFFRSVTNPSAGCPACMSFPSDSVKPVVYRI